MADDMIVYSSGKSSEFVARCLRQKGLARRVKLLGLC